MREKMIRFKFDSQSKTGYIYFKDHISDGEAKKQVELEDRQNNLHIVLDFNEANEILGIELLSFGNLPKEVLKK